MSRILRRSGNAVTSYLRLLDWQPDWVVQVGIGFQFQEVDVMREAWPSVQFMGFEAHPKLISSLRRTYPGQVVHAAVCCDDSEHVSLYSKSRHKSGSSLFDHHNRNARNRYEVFTVPAKKLDEMNWSSIGNALLWIDAEGSELGVLQSGEEFISQKVKALNIEFTGVEQGEGWSRPAEVHAWLVEHGFRRVWVHTVRHAIGQYDAIYVSADMVQELYCMCPCSLRCSEKEEQCNDKSVT